MKNKTISFLDVVDGVPVENDMNEMISEMIKNHNKMGLGNFIIRVYREWRDGKKKLSDKDKIIKDNDQIIYYLKIEVEKLKKEIEELKK